MRPVLIYGLCLDDGRVRYVGKTVSGLAARLRQHRSDARRKGRLPVHRWMRKHGVDNVRIVALDSATVETWKESERTWIRTLGAADLLNLTKGGEGWPGGGFSSEHRAAISASLRKGRYRDCEVCSAPVWVSPSNERLGRGRFCSRACRNENDRRNPPRWNPNPAKGIAAAAKKRRAISHCPAGHEYSPENTRHYGGRRHCRACAREAARRHRKRKNQ